MNGCDCSFWSISRLSSSSLVFCILGMWGGGAAPGLLPLLGGCSALGPLRWDPQWPLVGFQGAQDP